MEKTAGKNSVLGRISKNTYTIIGAIILVIGIAHFAFQIFFIQKENLQAVETGIENKVEIKAENKIENTIENKAGIAPPAEQIIKIEPEIFEVKKIKVITIPEVVKPVPRRQKETVAAREIVKKPVRKKEIPETRTARLRRAERILTGI